MELIFIICYILWLLECKQWGANAAGYGGHIRFVSEFAVNVYSVCVGVCALHCYKHLTMEHPSK